MTVRLLTYRPARPLFERHIVTRHRPCATHICNVRSISHWEYADEETPHKREQAIRRAHEIAGLRKQRFRLEIQTQELVWQYLEAEFPTLASLKTPDDLWEKSESSPSVLSESAETLLTLNAFERVPLPRAIDCLMLAEGVVAHPSFYSRLSRSQDDKYFLFAQMLDTEGSDEAKKKRKLPSIVEDDIRVYRVLENQGERVINVCYNAFRSFVQRRIFSPIESTILQLQERAEALRGKSDATSISNNRKPEKVNLLPVKINPDEESHENLLVLGKDRTVMFADMTPSTRVVALPYYLGHKSASTLVSVSLVVFGAIPLAYRSLNFALDYAWLAETMAISVVGTISYGIWTQRTNARTSQSQAVSNALMHRVYAREDAVIALLREGAVKHVTNALLSEYFDRYQFPDDVEKSSVWCKSEIQLRPLLSLVNPIDVCLKMRLLEQDVGQHEGPEPELRAVPLDVALSSDKSISFDYS